MATERENSQQFDPQALFEKFKEYFDQKFHSLNPPESKDSYELKELKIKLESKDFVKPGNVDQYQFCGQLELTLDRIKLALIKNADIDKAIEAIQSAEDLINERKKKIRIAENSKAGWLTVSQFVKESNSELSAEQAKKVKNAEETVLKELESRKRKRRESFDNAGKINSMASANRSLFRGITNKAISNKFPTLSLSFAHSA